MLTSGYTAAATSSARSKPTSTYDGRRFGPEHVGGRHRHGGGVHAAAAAALVAAALALAEPGDEFGDILITTGSTFHLLRLMGPERVAYLALDRSAAHLALARQEFKKLTGRPRTVVPLPRRRNAPPVAATERTPGWLPLAGQTFYNDDAVLDRILGTLRRL